MFTLVSCLKGESEGDRFLNQTIRTRFYESDSDFLGIASSCKCLVKYHDHSGWK